MPWPIGAHGPSESSHMKGNRHLQLFGGLPQGRPFPIVVGPIENAFGEQGRAKANRRYSLQFRHCAVDGPDRKMGRGSEPVEMSAEGLC
jgi:hypothetical protein